MAFEQDLRRFLVDGPFDINKNLRGLFGLNNLTSTINKFVDDGIISIPDIIGGLSGDVTHTLNQVAPALFPQTKSPTTIATHFFPGIETANNFLTQAEQEGFRVPTYIRTIFENSDSDPELAGITYAQLEQELNKFRETKSQQAAAEQAIASLRDRNRTAVGGLRDEALARIFANKSGQLAKLDELNTRLETQITNPLFSTQDINSLVETNIDDLSVNFKSAVDRLNNNIAARGLSGAAAEKLRLNVSQDAARDFARVRRDIPTSLIEANRTAKDRALANQTSLAGLRSQVASGYDTAENNIRSLYDLYTGDQPVDTLAAQIQTQLFDPQSNLAGINQAILDYGGGSVDSQLLNQLLGSSQISQGLGFVSNLVGSGTNAALGLLQSLVPLILSRRSSGGNSGGGFTGNAGLNLGPLSFGGNF